LYYSSGTDWVEGTTKGHFKMERRDKESSVVLVASEPLTFERKNWVEVPTNTIVTIHKQTVSVRPIKDEFFNPDPSAVRSSSFALAHGLVTKAPGGGTVTPSTTVVTPAGTPRTNGSPSRIPRDKIEELHRRVGLLEEQND
jgi:glutamine amidotransferase